MPPPHLQDYAISAMNDAYVSLQQKVLEENKDAITGHGQNASVVSSCFPIGIKQEEVDTPDRILGSEQSSTNKKQKKWLMITNTSQAM